VGMPRRIPFIVPKIAFGFSENTSSRGFSDKFDQLIAGAPFLDKFESPRTALELDDYAYRFFIKAKIAFNNSSAYIVSDTRVSIQESIASIFGGEAYVSDNMDMTLDLYVSPTFDINWLKAISTLELLPRPQAVRYRYIVQAIPGVTFGFSDNPSSKGFSDKFDPLISGGIFASKVI